MYLKTEVLRKQIFQKTNISHRDSPLCLTTDELFLLSPSILYVSRPKNVSVLRYDCNKFLYLL